MSFLDVITMGLKNLWRRKVRTLLTILGVVIGTASIVVMLSLGIGMEESFQREMENMGSLNIIDVDTYYFPDDMSRGGAPQQKVLDDKAIMAISKIKGVEAVTPILETYLKFVAGKEVAYVSLVGIDISTMEAFDYKVAEGRLLQPEDTNGVVFGSNIPTYFYNPKTAGRFGYYGGFGMGEPSVNLMQDKLSMTFDMSYGEKRQPGPSDEENKKPATLYKVKGIGLLEESFNEKDYSAYMDIHQVKKLVAEERKNDKNQRRNGPEQQGYQRAKVKVKDINKVDEVQQKIKDMEFGTYSLADLRKSMQKQSNTIQMILGGIGAISLLVAALGITNTMVMSIYERTKEIGIMKVLGCELSDLRRLFLFEAGIIGFLGGVAGIIFSFSTSYLLNTLAPQFMFFGGFGYGSSEGHISVIPLWLASASILFATIIGLVSGFYPARRAMKLSALEAIKTE